MRMTENRLRSIIRSVIRESRMNEMMMHDYDYDATTSYTSSPSRDPKSTEQPKMTTSKNGLEGLTPTEGWIPLVDKIGDAYFSHVLEKYSNNEKHLKPAEWIKSPGVNLSFNAYSVDQRNRVMQKLIDAESDAESVASHTSGR